MSTVVNIHADCADQQFSNPFDSKHAQLHLKSVETICSMFSDIRIAEHSRFGYLNRTKYHTPFDYFKEMNHNMVESDATLIRNAVMGIEYDPKVMRLNNHLFHGMFHLVCEEVEYLAFLDGFMTDGMKLWGGIVAHFKNEVDAIQFKLASA